MAQTTGPLNLSDYISTATDRAYKNWGRGDEMFDWAKKQFEQNAATSKTVTDQALDTARTGMDWAKTDRAQYERDYMPAMKEQLDYARSYTTPERMAANRAGAIAGANITFDAAGDMAKRALQGYGVDPSAGRFAGLDAGLAAKRATAAAGVGTKSDRDTEMMGQQLLANAIRTGQVLPGQAVNEAGMSLAAGNQAINTGLATTASGAQTMGTPVQWTGMGDDMIREWQKSMVAQTDAGLRANQQQIERDKASDSKSSGVGALIGAGAGILGSIYGGPIGGMIGSKLGSMAGGAIEGSGSVAAKGGRIEKFDKGGRVPIESSEQTEYGYDETKHILQPKAPQTPEVMRPRPKPKRYAEGGGVRRPFDPNGPDYDDETAEWEGLQPTIDEDDGLPHMPSRVPRTGMLLKGRNHPTFDKGVEEDRKLGYGLEMRDGRYYTQPFQKFEDGGGVDAVANSIWGDGTPLAFAEGGEVPEDDFVDAVAEQMPTEDDVLPEEVITPEEEVPNLVTPEMSPSGGEETDDVHALLNEGEFVIPRDVTNWYGEKYFQNLIQRAYKEKQAAQAQPEEASPQQEAALATSSPAFESMGA